MRLLADSVNLDSFDPSRAVTPGTSSTLPAAGKSGRTTPPALRDDHCDRVIPNRVLGAWKPEGGVQALRRALDATERAQLNRRAFALECALSAVAPSDIDLLDMMLHGLLGGWRNQRRTTDEAEIATVSVLRRLLRGFPLWAIEQGLSRMLLDPRLDPHFVPSDAEIVRAVDVIARPYRLRRDAIKTLLAAPVEAAEPAAPKAARTFAELYADECGRLIDGAALLARHRGPG